MYNLYVIYKQCHFKSRVAPLKMSYSMRFVPQISYYYSVVYYSQSVFGPLMVRNQGYAFACAPAYSKFNIQLHSHHRAIFCST